MLQSRSPSGIPISGRRRPGDPPLIREYCDYPDQLRAEHATIEKTGASRRCPRHRAIRRHRCIGCRRIATSAIPSTYFLLNCLRRPRPSERTPSFTGYRPEHARQVHTAMRGFPVSVCTVRPSKNRAAETHAQRNRILAVALQFYCKNRLELIGPSALFRVPGKAVTNPGLALLLALLNLPHRGFLPYCGKTCFNIAAPLIFSTPFLSHILESRSELRRSQK